MLWPASPSPLSLICLNSWSFMLSHLPYDSSSFQFLDRHLCLFTLLFTSKMLFPKQSLSLSIWGPFTFNVLLKVSFLWSINFLVTTEQELTCGNAHSHLMERGASTEKHMMWQDVSHCRWDRQTNSSSNICIWRENLLYSSSPWEVLEYLPWSHGHFQGVSYLFMYLFVQQLFFKDLLCARQCARS